MRIKPVRLVRSLTNKVSHKMNTDTYMDLFNDLDDNEQTENFINKISAVSVFLNGISNTSGCKLRVSKRTGCSSRSFNFTYQAARFEEWWLLESLGISMNKMDLRRPAPLEGCRRLQYIYAKLGPSQKRVLSLRKFIVRARCVILKTTANIASVGLIWMPRVTRL